jgi:adenylate cyclase
MPGEAERAILFADVSGSTRLYDTLGDAPARAIVARCVAVMTDITQRYGGAVVKTIGDEVMATFADAAAAAAAAVAMQEAISAEIMAGGRRLAIRVGFHFGPVLVEDADVFGDAVNLASRMANQAKPAQILTTGATVACLSGPWPTACRLIDRAEVRGKRELVEVFEVVWQAEDATLMRHVPLPLHETGGGPTLVLSLDGTRVELNDARPTVTIGRGDQNDLVVHNVIVSRLHARVEFRNGRFVFTDQSANGTYVVPDAASPVFVHRDSYVLAGTGCFSLGEAPAPAPAPESQVLVRYEVTQA